MEDIGWEVLSSALNVLVVAVVLGPVIWLRALRAGEPALSPGGWSGLGAVALLFVGTSAVLRLPHIGPFADLTWNWQNKLLLVVLLSALIWVMPGLTWRLVGLRRPRRGWWIPVLGALVLGLGFGLVANPESSVDAESVVFLAILPGIDEELLYRGVMLLMLDHAIRARRQMWGGSVGWSVVITAAVFGLAHGLQVQPDGITIDPGYTIVSAGLGLAFAWLRIRWDSLLPAVLAHNAWNVAFFLAPLL